MVHGLCTDWELWSSLGKRRVARLALEERWPEGEPNVCLNLNSDFNLSGLPHLAAPTSAFVPYIKQVPGVGVLDLSEKNGRPATRYVRISP
jgi:hypothetical protein